MQTVKITQWRAAAFISLFLLAAGSGTASSSNEQQPKLTDADESAIRATIEAYRTAWLANDAKGVLKTFSDDAVLLPAHGAPAVVGIAAIEKYWFTPGGPPTIITELNITVDQAGGNGTLAYARGLDGVVWTVTEAGSTRRHSHPGTYLNVMRKQPDGSWRIQVHMWDDGPEHVE
jgi:uncharacterized protein (TIGR02246 family)